MEPETMDNVNSLKRLEDRIARLKRRAKQLEGVSNKYWRVRRVVFVCGVLLTVFFCKYSGQIAGWVGAALFVAIFSAVANYHKRVRDSITRNSLMVNIKQVQLARIHLDWDEMPRPDQSRPHTSHPFETDLDITGERSLHRLLDCAVTKEASDRLKSWLLNTAPETLDIKKRQSLVKELKGRSLFRDKLHLYSALASGDSPGQWNSNILLDWIAHPGRKDSLLSSVRLLGILAGSNIGLGILDGFNLIPPVWPIAFLIYVSVLIAKRAQIGTAWGELQELEKTLRRFSVVFRYLESRGHKNRAGLTEVCSPFLDKLKRPSAKLRKVERMAAALGLRTNPVLWLVVHAFIPWDFYFTYRLESLKEDITHLLPIWLDAWYEIEALNSLANFAYLNPRYVFPEIVSEQLVFGTRALGHPLIRPQVRVSNDFELNQHQKIAILTGSNMAGKSTFLRTIGVNLCLTYAGAPVNADFLQVSLFRLFTCIQVTDSMQDGLSYFYAEVKRLKALLSATEMDGLPVMFVIDEIYRGTNNRERRIGSSALIRALSSRRTAVGIIATHDLDLIKLVDEIPGIANYHFREQVADRRMVFDYLLRPGPCPTTNALQIMQIEGLPVDL